MTPEQIAKQFHEDGFVVIPQLFAAEEVGTILSEIDAYIEAFASTLPPGEIYFEDGPTRAVKSIVQLDERMSFFSDLRTDPRLVEIIQAIWPGCDVIPRKCMYFGKAAGEGGAAPAHQDNAFQCWDPPDALTLTIALDASSAENGALCCRRGSHQAGLLPHRQSGMLGFSQTLANPGVAEPYVPVPLCMAPGDAALHHINTIHASDANLSDRPRRQLGIGYRSSRAHRDDAAWQKYQQDLAELHGEN